MKFAIHAVLIGALAMASAPLMAQDIMAQDVQSPGKACKTDREKFCPGMKQGDGKLGSCMKEHAAELSPDCTAAMEARKQAQKAVQANCKADIAKFCADAAKGHGAVNKCLESHAGDLEQPCADALKPKPVASKSA